MSRERYQRLKALVFEASALAASDRAAFLARECGDDAALRDEVLALLADEPVNTTVVRPGMPATTGDVARSSRRAPLPDKLGHYRLAEELGRGGMGVVVAAVDERSGESVAVKLVHPHLIDSERTLERFRREARLGASISHRGVVRTLDVGEATIDGETHHFLVMERVAGRTLRTMLSELGVVPEALVREIGRQAAAGLAAIHAASVVHRDVKPENLLITGSHGDERVRIMDLGIARLADASVTLTHEGQFLGSLAHAAPEQFHGADVGPQADLYALGVTLYELVTGTNPFRRESAAATISAHLDLVPRPARELVPSVSPFLTCLLASLLEKSPENRLPSAVSLRQVLAEGEDGDWWRSRETEDGRHDDAPSMPVARQTSLHGRDAELAVAREAWRQALEGTGSVLSIVGPRGSGKSRLADEVARMAATSGAVVLHGGCTPGADLGALAESLGGPRGTRMIERHLRDAPALRDALLALARDEHATRRDADALPAAFARLFEAACAERPTVWIVEDLHFGSRAAWSIAAALAHAAARRRGMVVLTLDPSSDDELRHRLGSLPIHRRVDLAPLSVDAVRALVAEALGDEETAATVAQALQEGSGGSPALVVELLRSLQDSGAIARSPGGGWRVVRRDAVLRPAREAIAARLSSLARDERAVLDVAAVLGEEIDAKLVAEIMGMPLVAVLRHLAELERRHGLVRSVGRLHRFVDPNALDVARDELPPTLAAECHALAAERLLARLPSGESPAGRQAALVAEHFIRGTRPREAAPHVVRALDWLASRHLHERALELATRALEDDALLDPEARVNAQLHRARALDVLGRRKEQREAVEAGLAGARAIGDPKLVARALACSASLAFVLGDSAEAMRVFERSRALGRESGDRAIELEATCNMATLMGRLGRDDEALALHAWARDAAKELGDATTESASCVNAATILTRAGSLREAVTLYEEGLAVAREAGNVRIEAHAEGGLTLALYHLGELAASLEHGLRGIELARSIGDRRSEAIALGNSGITCTELGRIADALRLLEANLNICIAIDDRRGAAVTLDNLGHAWLMLGDAVAARGACEEARRLAEETSFLRLVGYSELRLARVSRREGDCDGAIAHVDAAQQGFAVDGDAECHAAAAIERALIERARGDDAAAIAALDVAVAHGPEVENPTLLVLASLERAVLAKDGATEAVALLRAGESKLGAFDRLRARHLAWRVGGDVADLVEAHALLERVRAAAPPEHRASMIAQVPAHRAIAEDWARQDLPT